MKSIRFSVCFVALMFGAVGTVAFAGNDYQSTFAARYGMAGAQTGRCQICHPGGDSLVVNSFAIDFANAGNRFTAIEDLDSDGDGYANLVEILAGTNPGDPQSHPTASAPDAIAPRVVGFNIPETSPTLSVPIESFAAFDNRAVTGYLITETPETPSASSTAWRNTKPARYAFPSAGAKILYAWAKDAAGNVSTPASAATKIMRPSDASQAAVAPLDVAKNRMTPGDDPGLRYD